MHVRYLSKIQKLLLENSDIWYQVYILPYKIISKPDLGLEESRQFAMNSLTQDAGVELSSLLWQCRRPSEQIKKSSIISANKHHPKNALRPTFSSDLSRQAWYCNHRSVYFIIFMYFFIENSPLPREGVGGTSGDFIWGKNINNQQTKKRKYETRTKKTGKWKLNEKYKSCMRNIAILYWRIGRWGKMSFRRVRGVRFSDQLYRTLYFFFTGHQ